MLDYGIRQQRRFALIYLKKQTAKLSNTRRRNMESTLLNCYRQIKQKAINRLHSLNIVHRDIKASNIFIQQIDQQLTFKLADFNVSKVIIDNLNNTQTGTPYYASPEVWKKRPYDQKSDIWSLGCVIYEMANLAPPFKGKDLQLYQIGKAWEKIFVVVTLKSFLNSIQMNQIISQLFCQKFSYYFQTNPIQRVSAQVIIQKIEALNNKIFTVIKHKQNDQDEYCLLINQILLPEKIENLNKLLPASQYHFIPPKQQLSLFQLKQTNNSVYIKQPTNTISKLDYTIANLQNLNSQEKITDFNHIDKISYLSQIINQKRKINDKNKCKEEILEDYPMQSKLINFYQKPNFIQELSNNMEYLINNDQKKLIIKTNLKSNNFFILPNLNTNKFEIKKNKQKLSFQSCKFFNQTDQLFIQ